MEYLDEPLDRPAKSNTEPLLRDLNIAYYFPGTLIAAFSTSLLVAGVVDYRSWNMTNPSLQKRVFRFVGGVWTPLVLFSLIFPVAETALWERVRQQVWFWQTAYLTLPNPRLLGNSKK